MSLAQSTGLAVIGEGMTWEDRIEARVSNITLLCDAVQREILLIGAELAACKWSGEFIIDSVWTDDDQARSWSEWLKRRNFKLTSANRETKVDRDTAAALMAWASCTATIAEANQDRSIPLPMPSSPAQLEPYLGSLARVDDWRPENWPERATDKAQNFVTEPPYAAQQPEFVRKWEQVYNQLPPEKRLDKEGSPKPPGRHESAAYLAKERQMLTPDVEAPVYDVNRQATTAERMAAAAQAPKPKAPKKSQRELEEERQRYELEANTRKYRMQLLSLHQASEALEGMMKTFLATYGSDYLDAMRDLDLGAYSVTEDVELLRKSVKVLQSCFRLATEVYIAPEEIKVPEVIDV